MTSNRSHEWWLRLGGPNAISMPAWLLTLPGAVLTPLATNDIQTAADAWAWMALGLFGHAVVGVVLALAHATYLSSRPRPSRPWAFVATLLAAGLARGLAMALAGSWLGLAKGLDLPLRLTGAPGSLLLWFAIATLLVDGTRRHRTAMTDLQSRLRDEQALAGDSVEAIRQHRAAVVDSTKRTVTEQLEQAISLSGDPEQAALHLRSVVDDVVRPLSHELGLRTAQESALLDGVVEAARRAPMPVRGYLDAMTAAGPSSPTASIVILLGSSSFLAVAVFGPVKSAVILGLGSIALWLLTRIGRPLSNRTSGRLSRRTRVFVACTWWVLTALATALTVTLAAELMHAWPGDAPGAVELAGTFVAVAAITLVAQVAVAAYAAVVTLREVSEEDLREATRGVEWARARLRQLSFVESEQLGRALHGDIQARIVSLALQIQLNPPADVQAAIADLADHVRSSLSDPGPAEWRSDLDEIGELWSLAITLVVDVAPSAADALDRDALAGQAAVAIVREAVTNAVRHAEAETVQVRMRPDTDAVLVVVTNDGMALESGWTSGLGMSVFDAACLEWCLEPGLVTQLRARIACSTLVSRGDA